MPIYQAVVLALIQALTEFLPISSTAHLYLFPWLFGWPDPGLAFTMAVHAGTLVGVILYFLRTWIRLTLCGIGVRYPADSPGHEIAYWRRMFWYLVAATLPAAGAGYIYENAIETSLRNPWVMGISLIAIGLLMWAAEVRSRFTRGMESLGFFDAMLIGISQAIALIPGVSRSGITITAGLFRGLTREAAARFTFLLSTPIIAGAALKKLLELRHTPISSEMAGALVVGGLVSAFSGYLVIALLLRYLQTRTLKIFIYYRVAFGIVVLLLAFLRMGVAR